MKIQELRALSREDLLQKEKSLKEQLYKLNLSRYSGRVDKPHMFSLIKRDIARIQTILQAMGQTDSVTDFHVADTNSSEGVSADKKPEINTD